jgi:uncharacterized membrane protein
MKTAQNQEPPITDEPQKTAPIFTDVNADCQSIVVNAPAAEVYRRLLRCEDLPRFMTSISKVDKLNATQFSCTLIINGEEVKSDVQITMRVPDRRIAWQTVSDHFGVGVVFLEPLLGDTTKVTVKVCSMIEPAMLSGALRNYLGNFKRVVEHAE